MTNKSTNPAPTGEYGIAPVTSATDHLWQAAGTNTDLHGRILLNVLGRTIARLEAMRTTINAQNGELLQRAAHVHDMHQSQLTQLRKELQDPTNEEPERLSLEDAYGQHLLDRASADDLMTQLHWNRTNFQSRTSPDRQGFPQLNVPPAIGDQDAQSLTERDNTSDNTADIE